MLERRAAFCLAVGRWSGVWAGGLQLGKHTSAAHAVARPSFWRYHAIFLLSPSPSPSLSSTFVSPLSGNQYASLFTRCRRTTIAKSVSFSILLIRVLFSVLDVVVKFRCVRYFLTLICLVWMRCLNWTPTWTCYCSRFFPILLPTQFSSTRNVYEATRTCDASIHRWSLNDVLEVISSFRVNKAFNYKDNCENLIKY